MVYPRSLRSARKGAHNHVERLETLLPVHPKRKRSITKKRARIVDPIPWRQWTNTMAKKEGKRARKKEEQKCNWPASPLLQLLDTEVLQKLEKMMEKFTDKG